MEPIQIDISSLVHEFSHNDEIVVVCSNVIYVGTLERSGAAPFFKLKEPRVLPIDAIHDIERRIEDAPKLGPYEIEINKFQVQAIFER